MDNTAKQTLIEDITTQVLKASGYDREDLSCQILTCIEIAYELGYLRGQADGTDEAFADFSAFKHN